MTNFTTHENHVRVDFFKTSGKWYTTEEVVWTGPYDHWAITTHFAETLHAHLKQDDGALRLAGMTAVCLAPYSKYAHPLMYRIPERA